MNALLAQVVAGVRRSGESRPIADNGTRAGQALNRRVEITAR